MAYLDELDVDDRVSLNFTALFGPDEIVEGTVKRLLPSVHKLLPGGSTIPDPTQDKVQVQLDNGLLAWVHPLALTILEP
jgi:hypothetical protein